MNPDGPDGRIYLIGLMGAGKTTVGRALAARLTCDYVDNDATVAQLAGHSTLDLSHADGTSLHGWEARYVRHVSSLAGTVVCGIPASAADRTADLDLLTCTGRLIYLRCDPATLAARIGADPPRPWIEGDVASIVTAMYHRRDPILRAAAFRTLDATAAPEAISEQIAGLVSAAWAGRSAPVHGHRAAAGEL